MRALISFETLATIHPITQRHIPEYQDALQRVNLKQKRKDFTFKLSTDSLLLSKSLVIQMKVNLFI